MITEVNSKHRWSCCPLMSGQPVPIAPPAHTVLQPNQVAIAPMRVPCATDACPLFDPHDECCELVLLGGIVQNLSAIQNQIAELRRVFEPPKGSPSPLMRVAEALENIVDHQKTK